MILILISLLIISLVNAVITYELDENGNIIAVDYEGKVTNSVPLEKKGNIEALLNYLEKKPGEIARVVEDDNRYIIDTNNNGRIIIPIKEGIKIKEELYEGLVISGVSGLGEGDKYIWHFSIF